MIFKKIKIVDFEITDSPLVKIYRHYPIHHFWWIIPKDFQHLSNFIALFSK